MRNACPIELRWSDAGNSPLYPGIVPCMSFEFRFKPAVDRRRSETDNRPTMLEPRDVLGEAVFGFVDAGPFPVAAGILRCASEDETDDERDGGREFRSGDMILSERKLKW